MSCSNITRTYHPFIGSTTDPSAPTPPPLTPPTIVPITQITLTFGATTVIVRNPRFGDKNEIIPQRINRESRNGEILIFASPDWPKIEKLILEFEGLTEAKTQELFYLNYVAFGDIVTLTDWESNTWTGIMKMGAVVRNRNNCGNAVTIEFEGERV